jgi:serine/threonine protein kinase
MPVGGDDVAVATMACPVCSTRHGAQEQYCAHCGLVFGSQHAPAAITRSTAPSGSVYCSACGHRARHGAKVCGACGTPLVWSYRPLQPGQVLANGRYTIQRALSKGGMGAIYVAHDHEAFGRPVVIKALLDYFDPHDADAARTAHARFLHEARTLAALRHPAIPHIFAYFAEGPYNYIVMEYVEGRDLDQGLTRKDDTTGKLVRGKAYADGDVVRWGAALCRVLQYLASRQPQPVIHQDIKPANLVLDHNSDDVRLVDFGTARARWQAHSMAVVGLHMSSVFGTQGYAAPEQYGGQSEPRSDVYALASTMYHLLTDDDPRDHPFDFPHLKRLGALGTILHGALHQDVAQRPVAALLRQQLEALLLPHRVHAIETPLGTAVANEQELVRWCEQHWDAAKEWLYDRHKLTDQIERFWGKNKLARDIRKLVQAHGRDRDAGLDAVLAALDPHGFGLAAPQLTAHPTRVDFGRLASDDRVEQPCKLTNTGRRLVAAQIDTPRWITPSQPSIELAPGASMVLTLHADMHEAGAGGKLRGQVQIRAGTTAVIQVGVEAEVSRWRSLWRRVTQPTMAASAVATNATAGDATAGANHAAPNVARVAAATQAEAQRKLKIPPLVRFGTVVVRNRGGAAAWFTKAERQKIQRLARELGATPLLEPLDVQCWHEFRIVCPNRATALAVANMLATINQTKKGVTHLDVEIVSS